MKTKILGFAALLATLSWCQGCTPSNADVLTQSKGSETTHTQSALQNKAQTTSPQLSSQQIQRLKSIRLKIAVPTYVPPRFQIARVINKTDEFYKGYQIVYTRSDNTCFSVEATSGGVGGWPELENSLPVKSKLFGDNSVFYGKYLDSAMQEQFSGYQWTTDWMLQKDDENRFYVLYGASTTQDNHPQLKCSKDITPQEAVRVTESLEYLK